MVNVVNVVPMQIQLMAFGSIRIGRVRLDTRMK